MSLPLYNTSTTMYAPLTTYPFERASVQVAMPTYGRSSQPRPTAETEIPHLNDVVEGLQDENISQHDTHCDQHEHLKLNEELKDQINIQDFHHSQEIDRLNREIRDLASHVEDGCIAHAKETEDLIWVVEMLQTQIMGQTEQIDTMKIEHEKEKAAAETAHSVQMDDTHDEWYKLITIQASAHFDETHRLKRKVKQSEYHFRAQAGTTENLEKVIEVLNDKVVAQDKTHRDEMNSIRASHVEEKDARRELHNEVMDILKDQHATEMETFRDWHYERVNDIRMENKGRMDGIKAEHDKEATIFWAMHDERLQTIKAWDDEEIGIIRGEQEKGIKTIEARHQSEIETLKNEHAKDIESIEGEHKQEIDSINGIADEEVELIKAEHDDEKFVLKLQHSGNAVAVKTEYSDATFGLVLKHGENMETLGVNHDREITEQDSFHTRETPGLTSVIKALQSEMEEQQRAAAGETKAAFPKTTSFHALQRSVLNLPEFEVSASAEANEREQEEIEHANKRCEGAESKENYGEDALDFVEDESEDAEQSGEEEWDVVDTSL